MPNRKEMKPDRRSEEQARRKWRGVLLRAYWSLFVAVIVVGGAKLFARFFGGP